ncbi:MAG: CBS domain-containing protein [Acidimicrobiaceae bacterium]|nr:CBS domain-containing protein [Acidimicrobiaceae bacterium]
MEEQGGKPRRSASVGPAGPTRPTKPASSSADKSKAVRRKRGGHRIVTAIGHRVNALGYLPKWFLLASVIGVIAGLGASLFYECLSLSTSFFLGFLAGYHPPTPAGEGGLTGSLSYLRAWAIPLVVTLGALLSGILVFKLAPEAEGHGTDAAIDAVHHDPRGIRLRVVFVKIIASALTIGSGGSGGREGPTAQISAGFGSLLARALDLPPTDGRIAVSVGIGSGIGAIFGAPLGGALIAAEIVYRNDFEYEALLPGALASIVAFAIFGAFFGYMPLFSVPGGYHFDHPSQLIWFAVIGILAGGIGILYSRSFYGMVSFVHKWPISPMLRPALGGLGVGLTALALPEVLGTGYGWVQKGISNQLLHTPLILVLLLPLARILATSFSIGTGGSGGVFGPGMVIGAFTGLAVWRVLEPIAPGVGHSPAPYVIIGMMAVFGGISRAPIAVMIMVGQMTGSMGAIAPAMVAVAISWFIVSHFDDSIYRSQLHSRDDAAHALTQFGLHLLAYLRVSSIATTPLLVLDETTTVDTAYEELTRADLPGAPVVNGNSQYLGTIDTQALAEVIDHPEDMTIKAFVNYEVLSVPEAAWLDVGLEALTKAEKHWVTVTNSGGKVVGILSIGDLVAGYRRVLEQNIGETSQITDTIVAYQEIVGANSVIASKRVAEAGLPLGCIIATLSRNNELIFVNGQSEIRPGDIISILVTKTKLDEVRMMVT